RQAVFGAQKRPGEHHAQQQVPLLLRKFPDRRDDLEARVVDQDVEAAEAPYRLLDHRPDLSAIPDIDPGDDGPAAVALDLRGGLAGGRLVDIADAYGRARGCQCLRDRPPYPAGGSGDDCGLALKVNVKPAHSAPSGLRPLGAVQAAQMSLAAGSFARGG